MVTGPNRNMDQNSQGPQPGTSVIGTSGRDGSPVYATKTEPPPKFKRPPAGERNKKVYGYGVLRAVFNVIPILPKGGIAEKAHFPNFTGTLSVRT